jgi:pyruvate dehydrogenase E1 component alpha subunit
MQKFRTTTAINLIRSKSKFLSTSSEITVPLGANVFATHNFDPPSTTVTTNKDELMAFFKQMYIMRRVEITNDTEYKV